MIKLITIEQLLEMQLNKQKFKLVEVLAPEEYKKGHIPGAINIPADSLPGKLKKNETVIVYCASYHCPLSVQSAKKLLKLGYKKVLDYKAAKKGWIDAGLELEK